MLTYFGVERGIDQLPADVWPTGMAPFIRLAEPGSRSEFQVDDGLFGLLPHFVAEIAKGRRTYNARSETVAQLPSFRESWAKGWRCIIPAEAVYEPYYHPDGRCERWMIHQPDLRPMGLAGIYRKWRHPDGREVFTFAMLTVNADDHPFYSRFHAPGEEKRMIVILDPADYGAWLSCPVAEAPRYLRQWQGELLAEPRPLPPRAPRAVSGRVVVPPAPRSGELF